MLKVWYDPALKKIHYDPTAKKILTTGAQCKYCPDPSAAPEAVAAEIENILCCAGVGECGSGGLDRYKFLDQGIGWDGEALLSRGRFEWSESAGLWLPYDDEDQWTYCYWSNVVYDDFGTYVHYNLDNCGGGIDYTVNLTSRKIWLMRGGNYWKLKIDFKGPKGSPVPPFSSVFLYDTYGGPWTEWCVPYGEYENENVCPNEMIGNGTVTLIEV